jgi:hypothetical protein
MTGGIVGVASSHGGILATFSDPFSVFGCNRFEASLFSRYDSIGDTDLWRNALRQDAHITMLCAS